MTSPAWAPLQLSTDNIEAGQYLGGFLNKTLFIHTNDGRMFVGDMKCTDSERNVILTMTYEYQQPTEKDVQSAADRHRAAQLPGNFRVDMRKRFVGLVVIPGQHITKIEFEE